MTEKQRKIWPLICIIITSVIGCIWSAYLGTKEAGLLGTILFFTGAGTLVFIAHIDINE